MLQLLIWKWSFVKRDMNFWMIQWHLGNFHMFSEGCDKRNVPRWLLFAAWASLLSLPNRVGAIYEPLWGTVKFNTLPRGACATPVLNCRSLEAAKPPLKSQTMPAFWTSDWYYTSQRWIVLFAKIVRHWLRHLIFHATYSRETCAKRDLLKPQPAESSHPRSQGSKKRPLMRRPPLLHVPPPPFCQIATNQSSISVQCFQFSPPPLPPSLGQTPQSLFSWSFPPPTRHCLYPHLIASAAVI